MRFIARTVFKFFIWTWLTHHTHQTNATFWRKATMQSHPRELKPWAWHWLAGYQRMLIKVSTFLTVTVGFWGWFWHQDVTEYSVLAMFLLAAVVGGWQGYRTFRLRTHTREVVKPIHNTLGHHLGYFPARPEEWLTVPLDYYDEDTSGTRVELPPAVPVPAEVQRSITELMSHKLGISDLSVAWHLKGSEPYVVFRPEPSAPKACSYEDVAELMRNSPDTAPVVGLTKRNRAVSLDLEDESPHILISAGSGGGKSVLARAIIMQMLRHGAQVVICDRKRISHKWAKDLPGVSYHRDIADIHHALIELSAEGDRRNRLTDHDEVPELRRVVLVFEEMNATVGKLREYWEDARDKTDPKRSPAISALGDLVNMGRQVKMNVVAIGQRIEARTLGGGDIRESFGIRALARFSVQTWKMLASECPMPRKSKQRGRWYFVTSGESTETQVVFVTDSDAQMFAGERVDLADKVGTVGVGTETLVTLREAFGDQYDRLRKAAQRDPAFPDAQVSVTGGANLYQRVAVRNWLDTRETATLEGAAA